MIRTRSGLIVPRHDRRFGTVAEKDWRRDGLHVVRDLGWSMSETVAGHPDGPSGSYRMRRSFTYHGAPAGADRQYFAALQEPGGSQLLADTTAITGTTEALMWPAILTGTPAYSLRAGQQFKIIANGVTTTPASAATTLTLTPRYGTSTGGTTMGASVVSGTAVISLTNTQWNLIAAGTVRSIGTATSTMAVTLIGFFNSHAIGTATNAGTLEFGGTALTTADQSTLQGFVVGATLGGSASWTLATRTVQFEISN